MDDIDQTTKDLQLLSQLKAGKTLSTTKMKIIDHSTWGSAFYRRYNREDRGKTLEKINEILNAGVEKAQQLITIEDSKSFEFIQLLKDAIAGVYTLKETYDNDIKLGEMIDEMISAISNDKEYIIKKRDPTDDPSALSELLENRDQLDDKELLGKSGEDDHQGDGEKFGDKLAHRVDHLKKAFDTKLVDKSSPELSCPPSSRKTAGTPQASTDPIDQTNTLNSIDEYTDFQSGQSNSSDDLFSLNTFDLKMRLSKKKSRKDI